MRAFMESRFDHDFSRVRVHVDGAAAQSAREHHAKAFTRGDDIVFGANQFAPSTHSGRRLIAHELAHVVQQRRGGESPGAAHEDDADSAAQAVLNGSAVHVRVGSARGMAQLTPDQELDDLLRKGPGLTAPGAEEQRNAVARLSSGTATEADRVTLIRQSVAESRALLQAAKGLALSYSTCQGMCGAGRDAATLSFGSLAAGSPTLISVARFQSNEVFGGTRHAFTVITFADGTKYLVDPTFAQFLRPSKATNLKGATAQGLRSDPNAARLLVNLVRDGFVKLDEANAQVYARALGVSETDAGKAATTLLKGEKAVFVEQVGQGNQTIYKFGKGAPDALDRSELIKSLRKDHIPKVTHEGDPLGVLPELKQLAERLEPTAPKTSQGGGGDGGGGGGAKTTPPPTTQPRAPNTDTTRTSPTTSTSSSTRAEVGPKLEPIVEGTPGFKPEIGAGIGGAIQILQAHQFAGLQGDQVDKYLAKFAQLQPKIDKFFNEGYSVEVALIVEKPDRPDVFCGAGVFCDSSQIIYFRDIFITRVESTAPPRFPTTTDHPQAYPTGGRDSFIPYTYQGGSIIEEHEIPHLEPEHDEHHTEYKKETFYPPPKFVFSPARPKPAPPVVKVKRDPSKDTEKAAAATPVYLWSANIKQAVMADAIAKRLAGNKLFTEVKQEIGGGFHYKRSRLSYFNPLDKPKADALAEAARAAGLTIVPELSGDGDHDPGSVQIMFGEDAER